VNAALRRAPQPGFSYIGLLILMALIAAIGAGSLQLGAVVQRRHAEEALLVAGASWSEALRSYARSSRPGEPDAPATAGELLRDSRFPGPVRHLRQVPIDPISGQAVWGLVREEGSGRILGAYSLSNARPIKIAGFDPRFPGFDGQRSYRDWRFMRAQDIAVDDVERSGLIRPGRLVDGAAPPPTGEAPAAPDPGYADPRSQR
jgi:type II secretory pathway pseudopilin PulG